MTALLCVLCAAGNVWKSDRVLAQNEAPALPLVRQILRPEILNYYRPDVWGSITMDLENRSDETTEVVTGGYFKGTPLNRYARQVMIPPQSARRVTLPVLPVTDADNKIFWHPILYRPDSDTTALMRASDVYRIDSEFLQQPRELVTVALSDQTAASIERWRSLSEFAVTARLQQQMTRKLVELNPDNLPLDPTGLDVADQIFLGCNRIIEDPARMAVLRSWVEQGGHLWVRLDYVEPDTVQQLFADSLTMTTVDRCSLNTIQFYNTRVGRRIGEPLEFEYPVDFVRVIVDPDQVEIIQTVNGWPASFLATVGRGRVAFTTLGDRAWMRERTESPRILERHSKFVNNVAFGEVIDEWVKPTDPPPLEPADFEPMLAAQVAYEIPDRSTILSVLGAFCGCLLIAGWWLHRSTVPVSPESADGSMPGRRLERLAVIGPVLALLAALPIVVLGQASRRDVPASMNLTEFVEASPTTSTLKSSGSVAVFSPDTAQVNLQGTDGRMLTPPAERLSGTLQQMTRSQFHTTEWQQQQVSSGLQFLQTSRSHEIDQFMEAAVTFGPDGVTGSLSAGPFSDPQDLLIAGPAPDVVAVDVSEDGGFTADAASTLPPGVYLPGSVLTDEQVRRQGVFRRLLAAKSESRYPRQPVLLAWMLPQSNGFHPPDGFERTDHALVAIPIEYRQTPPNTDVRIPSPFLSFTDVASDGGGRSTVYNRRTQVWRDGQQPAVTLMKFRIPDSVKPLRLTEVQLEFRLLAPSRNTVISVGSRDQLTLAAEVSDAAGTYDFTLTEPDQLRLDADGNYFVQVDVQATDEARAAGLPNQKWHMDYVRLEVAGRTLDPVASRTTQENAADE